jgi:hypothetical protein
VPEIGRAFATYKPRSCRSIKPRFHDSRNGTVEIAFADTIYWGNLVEVILETRGHIDS